MGQTLDLGRRIELCSLDAQFHNISVGLYRREENGESQVLVHTYSQIDGAHERIAFIRHALLTMTGLQETSHGDWLKFHCGSFHRKAITRSFLDLCKLPTGSPLELKPLQAFDKRAKCDLTITSLGNGRYQTGATEETATSEKRTKALAVGFAKVCEMSLDEATGQITFPCGCDHDSLMGLMFFRAQNVRAAMREEEMAASRGVLAPPSQQE